MSRNLLFGLIRFYQAAVSPHLGRSCRFYPTCSDYALQAIEKYGSLRGSFKAFTRICRCHPFHPGGYDPLR
ncbi:MAG: membrane protein insertion efficiency factor YidD [Gracilibacteraceae bacterium]|nr:membrane protein insertion efficiency factor YidD [Gracilibacteraceae bacterium]MDR1320126.1 membrane protein insertion efficiency factor YidD [Gracilibacteraceae bacterium]